MFAVDLADDERPERGILTPSLILEFAERALALTKLLFEGMARKLFSSIPGSFKLTSISSMSMLSCTAITRAF